MNDIWRKITTHQVNDCNRAIGLEACTYDLSAGAPTVYALQWRNTSGGLEALAIEFHTGLITDVTRVHIADRAKPPESWIGVNGLTNEVLLAILIDRLSAFQAGPLACDKTADALHYLELAQEAMHARTKERQARGVEGTREP